MARMKHCAHSVCVGLQTEVTPYTNIYRPIQNAWLVLTQSYNIYIFTPLFSIVLQKKSPLI